MRKLLKKFTRLADSMARALHVVRTARDRIREKMQQAFAQRNAIFRQKERIVRQKDAEVRVSMLLAEGARRSYVRQANQAWMLAVFVILVMLLAMLLISKK